ncbi:MAG: pilus assembly PilX N-terminal domain-containing protein [Deltaproteobacteria bacterium]|nr:pilus assembly PilX N-terminal domain-containing protein [Deltaproteobacteria bacterium]MBW2052231.1 pilus assembly PilX N-terminal domain-containing protein [Deltaproteobacteria bacterium]MBW2141036.1 pilus assembly PilX N-terminal domain-containing protein [Deltaproteobacteria bacterium]MBW2322062.1 pilus assembly PilX N-terminal domain-containing protein [Deltaproteobacteria bacterium]
MSKHIRKHLRTNEEGSVLIMVLILMAVMSVIGLTASMMSRTEITISHNTKVSRQAFYAGDSGIEVSPKIVGRIIDEGSIPTDIPIINIDAGLRDEVMGYFIEADYMDSIFPVVVNPDLSQAINISNFNVDIDRDPTGAQFMPGGGVQFASGAEGVGAGTIGGVLIHYDFDSIGTAPNSARSYIDARYRKVVGVAGGK